MPTINQIAPIMFLCLLGIGCRSTESYDAARIHAQKSSELLLWLNPSRAPNHFTGGDPEVEQMVCDELIARHETDFLLESFNSLKDPICRKWLVCDILYSIDDPKIYAAFAARLNEEEDEESYCIADYIARRGNTAALAVLNRHYFKYPISSAQWSYTVELFGKYKYSPATSNLIDSIDAASLNLAAASCDALQQIFPDSPKEFKGPSEAQEYYTRRIEKDAQAR